MVQCVCAHKHVHAFFSFDTSFLKNLLVFRKWVSCFLGTSSRIKDSIRYSYLATNMNNE